MKKPLILVGIGLVLAVLCAYMWVLVQPVAESDTLKARWQAGGGVRGVVTGRIEDVKGAGIGGQKFKLWTETAVVEGETGADGGFSVVVPSVEVRSVEVPGSGVLRLGSLAPSAVEGLRLTVVVR